VPGPHETLDLVDESLPSRSSDGPRPVRAHVWRPRGGKTRGTTRAESRPVGTGIGHDAFLDDDPEHGGVRRRVGAEAVEFFDRHV